jgi:AP-3 complex subunit beta
VRIHRDRREIQYIVLVAIRTLVQECPSAFSPFLNDFFVKGMDPPFTRMIKLDILVFLSTDPKSIDAVLTELRTYVRHGDKTFACAAIRAVGKVSELALVAYDRRAHTAGDLDAASARAESTFIALNCLSGLVTLSEFSKNAEVVGECAETMQRILSQLLSDDGMPSTVKDTARVQERALKRLLLILVRSLDSNEDNVDEQKSVEQTQLQLRAVRVPDSAVASIIFIVGEWLTMSQSRQSPWNINEKSRIKIRLEVLRLLAKQFTSLDPRIKLQAVHLASKVLLTLKANQASSPDVSRKECAVSELIFAMARVDILQDVRDRARYEGNILHMSVGLSYDTSALHQLPSGASSITLDMAKSMLLLRKPNASSLPLDSKNISGAKNDGDVFRFGTLSNVICNRTVGSTNPLPAWATEDSPGTLRDASASKKSDKSVDRGENGLYSSSSDDESSSSDGSSSSSSEESGDESSDSESTDSSHEEKSIENNIIGNGGLELKPAISDFVQNADLSTSSLINNAAQDESSSESSSDDNSDSESSDESTNKGEFNGDNKMKTSVRPGDSNILDMVPAQFIKQTSSASSVAAGLEDLVMAPLVGDTHEICKPSSIDDECGRWKEYVRPTLSGGLLVKMRFVHGTCKARETQVMGLDTKSPSTVCLQVHVENM